MLGAVFANSPDEVFFLVLLWAAFAMLNGLAVDEEKLVYMKGLGLEISSRNRSLDAKKMKITLIAVS